MKKIQRLLATIFVLAVTLSCFCSFTVSAEANTIADARNGVVRILSHGYEYDANGNLTEFFSTGSGFAIGTAGEPTAIFVTNEHVVHNCDEVFILLDDEWFDEWYKGYSQGKLDVEMSHAVRCEVVYTPDAYPDYAILRAERIVTERVALPMMSASQVTPGDTIYALGYPSSSDAVTGDADLATGSTYLEKMKASVDSMTITKGVVSRHTNMNAGGGVGGNAEVLQIDADINHGNSGGPLLTEDGYVVGVNTWGITFDNQSVEVALNIDYIIDRVKNLREIGKLANFEPTVITERQSSGATENNDAITGDTGKDPGGNTLLIVLVCVIVALVAAVVVILFLKKKDSGSSSVSKPTTTTSTTPANPVTDVAEPEFPKTMPVVDTIPATMPAYGTETYRLVCEAGFFKGRRFAVDRSMRIGRDPKKNDLVFGADTAGVSGVHCIVTPVEGGVSLTDLGSSYGTTLSNGTKLTPKVSVVLKDGDSFSMGSAEQVFRIEKKEV